MKKTAALLLALLMLAGILSGCGGDPGQPESSSTTESTNATEDSTVDTKETETTETTESTETTETTKTTETTETTKPEDPQEPTYTYEEEEGLIAYWAFDNIEDGVVLDVTGNGHDGTIVGNPVITEGHTYKGLQFTELGQHVIVKDAEELNFSADDSFTLEIWFKWSGTQAGSNWPCMIQKGLLISDDAYKYVGFWINPSSKKIALGVTGNGGTGTYNMMSETGADTAWHKATAIQDGEANTISFYIDDVFQCQGAAIETSSPGYDLLMGYNGVDGQFIGVIDEVKLYDYAKEAEVSVSGVDSMKYANYSYTDPESGESFTLPYRAYYPSDYDADAAKEYPILLFLHGYGECGTDNSQQIRVLGGPNLLLDKLVAEDNCVILAPQCPADPASLNWVPVGKVWNTGSRELTEKPTLSLAAATELLKEVIAEEKIDEDRVYVAGISMGGYGTWEILARNPELFAAAIPVCGAGIPSMADELTEIAIWAMHGEADPTVPVSGTKDMEKAIHEAGGTKIKTTYYPGLGHSIWTQAFSENGLIEWLLSQSKANG